jgi:hypothetical protein
MVNIFSPLSRFDETGTVKGSESSPQVVHEEEGMFRITERAFDWLNRFLPSGG